MKTPFLALRSWISLAWVSFLRLLGVVRADRRLLAFVVALLAIDVCSILFFGVAKELYNTGVYPDLYELKPLRITTDQGYPELFNYAKTLLVVLLVAHLARSTRQPIYVALGVTFLVVLLDDSLEIHESMGKYLVRQLELRPMLGVRAQDVGEVITWAMLGTLVVPLILLGLLRSGKQHVANGLALMIPFGVLLFCGILVDQLYHSHSDAFHGAGILLDMTEDGGEMIAITMACALALAANRELRSARIGSSSRP